MRTHEAFAASGTVAQVFDRSSDAQAAAARLRGAGFSDVRLSESGGRTSEPHVDAAAGATESDFAVLLEQGGFTPDRARAMTRAVAAGAVLLTVRAGNRAADAAAVLAGQTVVAQPLAPVDISPAATSQVPGVPVTAVPEEPVVPPAAVSSAPSAAPGQANLEPGDQVVPLRAERLDVSTQARTSEARVRKEVVNEQQTISVPVQREQLVVERDGEPPVRIPLSDR